MAKQNILKTKEPVPRARAKKEAQKPRKNIKAIGPHKRDIVPQKSHRATKEPEIQHKRQTIKKTNT